jgi:hypothetical protein
MDSSHKEDAGPTGFPWLCFVWEFLRPNLQKPVLCLSLVPQTALISTICCLDRNPASSASAIPFNQSPTRPAPTFGRSLEVPPPHVAQPRDLCSPFALSLALELFPTTLGCELSDTSTSVATERAVTRPPSAERRCFRLPETFQTRSV